MAALEQGAVLAGALGLSGAAWAMVIGPSGDVIWSTLSGIGHGAPLQVTSDQGLVLGVTSNSFDDKEQLWLLKLDRTGHINIPQLASLSGSMLQNEHAVATTPMSAPSDVQVQVHVFSDSMLSEVTPVESATQSP